MQEEERRVRANSDHTGRPYFSINYSLSLSGRDLLAMALAECEPYDDPDQVKTPSLGHRRMSDTELAQGVKMQSLQEDAPGTPSTQNSRLRKQPSSLLKAAPAGTSAPSAVNDSVRRTKSLATMTEIELSRSAPALPLSRLGPNVESLQGFVTCLNSRNVTKYKVGQKYRDGVIVGIDDEHGKLIVYNAALPQGSLTVMKTRDASRYDRGFLVEDSTGAPIGTVHARDVVANILVVNTTVT
jgi:hypothetical protein